MHKFDVNKQPKKENCITLHFKKKNQNNLFINSFHNKPARRISTWIIAPLSSAAVTVTLGAC